MTTRFLAIALPLAVLLSVGAAVQDRFAGDLFLAGAIQDIKIAPFKETMEIASSIGWWPIMGALTLAFSVWALWRKQKAEGLVFGAALLAFGVNPVIKELVARPRPTDDLVLVWHRYDGMSFPSGHAYSAMVLFGLLYYLAPVIFPWRKYVGRVRVVFVLMIALIGLSRVYLGVHWPSDVLGGFLVGAIVLSMLIHLHRWLRPEGDVAGTG